MTRTHRIAALPGDGVGAEVLPVGCQVIDALAAHHGFMVTWDVHDWGCQRYLRSGGFMPKDGLDRLREADAVFLGAVGDPAVPDHESLWGLLLPIRRAFGQYANLRPVTSFPGVPGPLRGDREFDLLVVRENNEGEYTRIGGRLYEGTPDEMVMQSAVFTRRGTERIMRLAFEQARGRRGALASATKSNGLAHSMPFWDEVAREVAAHYPDISYTEFHVDALAAQVVLRPDRFDVIVGSNLFGDILSDLGAALMGGIGMAASANVNPDRGAPSMFEPVHGSAPDIAGHGVANPVGTLLSAVLMLRHLDETAAAEALTRAVRAALADPAARTPDIGGTGTTLDFRDAVLTHLVPQETVP